MGLFPSYNQAVAQGGALEQGSDVTKLAQSTGFRPPAVPLHHWGAHKNALSNPSLMQEDFIRFHLANLSKLLPLLIQNRIHAHGLKKKKMFKEQ